SVDLERAGFVGHREVRMVEYGDVAARKWMLAAAHFDDARLARDLLAGHNLSRVDGVNLRDRRRRAFTEELDAMRRAIATEDVDGRLGHDSHDSRLEATVRDGQRLATNARQRFAHLDAVDPDERVRDGRLAADCLAHD